MSETINEKTKKIVMIMAGVMISLFLAALDETITGTAMPKIIGNLNGMALYNWPFTMYMLCSTIAIPIIGRIADLYGHKLTYIIGIAIFLCSSMLCGFANNMIQFIIFRGIQGIGGGTLIANSFIIVGDLFAPAERAKYMGFVASMFGLASIIGPVLGGMITDMLGWHWIFFMNIPLGMIALIIIIITLPAVKTDTVKRKIDIAGAVFFIMALVPLLLAFTWVGRKYEWLSPQIIGMFLFSIGMLFILGIVEKKTAEPLIPLGHFKNRIFIVSLGEAFVINAVMFGVIMLIPLFIQKVIGSSATTSGAVLTPMSVSLIASAIITGIIITKTGKYKIYGIMALAIIGIGELLLQSIHLHTSHLQIVITTMIMGIGVGISMPVFDLASQNAFPHEQIGSVTSLLQFIRNVGGTVGSAFWGSIMLADLKVVSYSHQPLEELKKTLANSVHHAFLLAFLIIGAAFFTTFFLKEIPLRKTNQ
jgi:EmrB/QacA subfamily drug resistance transporter